MLPSGMSRPARRGAVHFDWNAIKAKILDDIAASGRADAAMPLVEWMEIRDEFLSWCDDNGLSIEEVHEGQKACRVRVAKG